MILREACLALLDQRDEELRRIALMKLERYTNQEIADEMSLISRLSPQW